MLAIIIPFVLVVMFAFGIYALADTNPSTAPILSIVTLVNIVVLASLLNLLLQAQSLLIC